MISLDVESSVFLYSVDIQPDRPAQTRMVSREKTPNSAIWTDMIAFEEVAPGTRIGVKWVTLGSAAPGQRYRATLSVLDESGALATARPGSSNPMTINGRIGPVGDPTDERSVNIVIR